MANRMPMQWCGLAPSGMWLQDTMFGRVTEETLREAFSAKGYVTDVQLKYTQEGKFRGFAFVGFKTEEQADAAIEFFNGTYIGATKALVEKCASLGSADKPRAWSKYAPGSSAHVRLHGEKATKAAKQDEKQLKSKDEQKSKGKGTKSKSKFEEVLADPSFSEFLAVHEKGPRAVWTDDVPQRPTAPGQDSAGEDQEDDDEEEERQEEEQHPPGEMSDMDFLKSKIVKKSGGSDGDATDSEEFCLAVLP
ncbi:probable RNA-binding protein 19 [Pollicipes pollicipes]|uniref:probable RNA-binding protein 19 n=1 Tax=Pollicipes pollicipes TaxID=41117 RepID=UPI0018854EF6|nr:probable RNA-binding protein 19 [Pollicipes pollicipes]